MFAATHQGVWVVPAALAVRTLLIAFVVILGLRLFGKRELGQMNVADLAAIMAIANGVQNAMTHGTGLLVGGIASATSLFLCAAGLAFLVRRSKHIERRIIGSPTLLVWEGNPLWERLQRQRVTVAELDTAIREYGLSNLDEVLTATLEPDGSISIIPKTTGARTHRRALKTTTPRAPRRAHQS